MITGARAQLIVDCGGRHLSALLVTTTGELVPWSQQIHAVAARHVSLQLLFDPRASEHPDFSWEDATDALMGTGPHNLLQRARRLGLRRPWDGAPAEALLVESPLMVLSSPAALADPAVRPILPAVSAALLDALLEPVFAFATERVASAEIDPIVVVPAHTGRHARLTLHRIFRRHGHRRLTIVHRELAVAMSFIEDPPQTCVVCDVTDDDLHVHTIAIEAVGQARSFTTVATSTTPGLGWRYWVQQIASGLQMPWPVAERGLTSLLTGSPDSLPRITHASIETLCNAEWREQQRAKLAERLDVPPAQKTIFAGEICGIESIGQLLGTDDLQTPYVDRTVQGVAAAALWLRGSAERTLAMPFGGSIRVNSFRNHTVPILTATQFPPPGESCSIASEFRLRGGSTDENSFVVHLLRGSGDVPEGNATLCVLPAKPAADRTVRLRVHMRRSRSGRRMSGVAETESARAFFSEELAVIGRPS